MFCCIGSRAPWQGQPKSAKGIARAGSDFPPVRCQQDGELQKRNKEYSRPVQSVPFRERTCLSPPPELAQRAREPIGHLPPETQGGKEGKHHSSLAGGTGRHPSRVGKASFIAWQQALIG